MVHGVIEDLDRELIRRGGLAEFVRQAWPVLEPATELRWGWALDAICQHLEAVTAGQVTRLLINVPPGMMKSLMTGVFWPAWEWGPMDRPELRVGGAAYSESYAVRDSRKMRDLVQSPWYQARWGAAAAGPEYRRVVLTRDGEREFENSRTGLRAGVPFVRLTGGRYHRVVVDDPHSTEGAESDADRLRAVRTFRESVPTRLVDPRTSAIVVIMQRLHVGDVSGEILAHPEWGYDHLMLPMRFEPARRCQTRLGFSDPRSEEDELLFSARFPEAVVARDEEVLGVYAGAGQLQQRPAPRGGGIVKEAWLAHRFSERGRNPVRVVQSWDCASKPAERNDPSACGTFAEFPDRVELWDVHVGRHEFPDLVRVAKDEAAEHRPAVVLVEDKDSGQQMVQQLRRDTKLPVVAVDPGRLDKVTRLAAESPFMEAGRLWLPEDAPWVAAYVAELVVVPAGRHDDQADMTSQALRWIREHPVRGPGAGVVSVERPSWAFV